MNWSEFFHMGGYAFYVWGSYLVTVVIIGAEVVTLVRRRKRLGGQMNVGSKSKDEGQ